MKKKSPIIIFPEQDFPLVRSSQGHPESWTSEARSGTCSKRCRSYYRYYTNIPVFLRYFRDCGEISDAWRGEQRKRQFSIHRASRDELEGRVARACATIFRGSIGERGAWRGAASVGAARSWTVRAVCARVTQSPGVVRRAFICTQVSLHGHTHAARTQRSRIAKFQWLAKLRRSGFSYSSTLVLHRWVRNDLWNDLSTTLGGASIRKDLSVFLFF